MSNFNQKPNVGNATRFSKSPMANVEFSRMVATPTWLLSMNAGDIVPVYYSEVLPHSTFKIDTDFVLRQTTLLRPVMGEMQIDLYAFFVPNRIINESWKNVQGENTSGFWSAPEVDLAPLYRGTSLVQIPVGSIADYYGFPTQEAMRSEVLEQCNDLKFRGYLEIYNNYFRDQNYQPPIPYSKLNIYNGFLQNVGSQVFANGYNRNLSIYKGQATDGSFAEGAVAKALFGEGGEMSSPSEVTTVAPRVCSWSALDKPLKANKLHDMFTSALPSPQKGADVYFSSVTGYAPVVAGEEMHDIVRADSVGQTLANLFRFSSSLTENATEGQTFPLYLKRGSQTAYLSNGGALSENALVGQITSTNMVADLSAATGVSINDLRTAIATQQVYETLARGGSRYTSVLRNFFELDTESPFPDIPVQLGHIRRGLDLYQVAQTSATSEDSPQATLSAYGYTNKGGHLFQRTFIEHGYVHVFAVVRQRNLYSTYFAQDNFRRSTLDFYLPQFANIGEQPLKLAHLNPFVEGAMEKAIGYQEAWSEYRYEPDRVHGQLRSGVEQSLDVWTYADNFEPNFEVITGDWLKSNAEEVMNRSLAVTSDVAPQFKAMFVYRVDKQLPMPTYSIPGLDDV